MLKARVFGVARDYIEWINRVGHNIEVVSTVSFEGEIVITYKVKN